LAVNDVFKVACDYVGVRQSFPFRASEEDMKSLLMLSFLLAFSASRRRRRHALRLLFRPDIR
jgi:hypothetical protein